MGYSPWGHKELDTTEATGHAACCPPGLCLLGKVLIHFSEVQPESHHLQETLISLGVTKPPLSPAALQHFISASVMALAWMA